MGMVDSKYRLVWSSCGYPGNSHDSVIFQSTDLWNQIKNQEYLPKIGKKVGSLLVPPLILGDAAFPLQPWLMKPCTKANPTLRVACLTVLLLANNNRAAVLSRSCRRFQRNVGWFTNVWSTYSEKRFKAVSYTHLTLPTSDLV